eukprot:8289473-Lingulodinium_polyedra.AAC.1
MRVAEALDVPQVGDRLRRTTCAGLNEGNEGVAQASGSPASSLSFGRSEPTVGQDLQRVAKRVAQNADGP